MSVALHSAESVTEGHPDKLADQISDAILDALLTEDPYSRVAVETLVTRGLVHVTGQITTKGYVDIPSIVRERILAVGYDSSSKGLDGRSCGVQVSVGAQSSDIAAGIEEPYEIRKGLGNQAMDRLGAGDQGMMFGYSCDETPELMPLPAQMAHRLAQRLAEVRKDNTLPYLRPDGKSQVTVAYEDGRPLRLEAVVISAQHAQGVETHALIDDVCSLVVKPVLEGFDINSTGHRLLVNPTGRFEIGGPMSDTGLTGRKIIVDTYGGMARHGGGAFSGKDPSKVDRSAAYAMRWVAKNVVAAGLARRCEVQVAYAIGSARPVGFYVNCFGSESVPLHRLQSGLGRVFDLRPAAIIRDLHLRQPIYGRTAAYGHFGRENEGFPWELKDRVDDLLEAFT